MEMVIKSYQINWAQASLTGNETESRPSVTKTQVSRVSEIDLFFSLAQWYRLPVWDSTPDAVRGEFSHVSKRARSDKLRTSPGPHSPALQQLQGPIGQPIHKTKGGDVAA